MLWPCFLLRRRAGQFSLEDSTHPDSHRSPRQHTLPFPPAARSPRTPWLLPPRPGAHAPTPSGQSLLSPLSTQRGFCCCRSDAGDAATLPLCRDGRLGLQSQEAPSRHVVDDRASPRNHGASKSSEHQQLQEGARVGSTTETDAGSGRRRHRSGLGWLIRVVACDPSLKPPTSRRALAVPLTPRVACADRGRPG